MSDYHILSSDKYGNRYSVVMHFSVPDSLNQVGINYRTAIVEYQGGAPIASVLSGIGIEQTQLDAGEIIERSYSFNSNPNETLLQKQAKLDTMWNEKRVQEQDDLQDVLGYWGYARDIP